MSTIEVKIRKLDGELSRYKEQMGKLRNGPGKVGFLYIYITQMNVSRIHPYCHYRMLSSRERLGP